MADLSYGHHQAPVCPARSLFPGFSWSALVCRLLQVQSTQMSTSLDRYTDFSPLPNLLALTSSLHTHTCRYDPQSNICPTKHGMNAASSTQITRHFQVLSDDKRFAPLLPLCLLCGETLISAWHSATRCGLVPCPSWQAASWHFNHQFERFPLTAVRCNQVYFSYTDWRSKIQSGNLPSSTQCLTGQTCLLVPQTSHAILCQRGFVCPPQTPEVASVFSSH